MNGTDEDEKSRSWNLGVTVHVIGELIDSAQLHQSLRFLLGATATTTSKVLQNVFRVGRGVCHLIGNL